MADEISVIVFQPRGRRYFQAQWTDPLSGKKKTRSTKQTVKKEAERFAIQLEEKLRNTRTVKGNVTWADLRLAYETTVYPGQRPSTRAKTKTTMDAVETILSPRYIKDIMASDVLAFQRQIRSNGVSEFTVKGHLAELRKVLRWAKASNMLESVVEFQMPRTKGSKGRAPTGEEFERMIAAAESIVGKEAAPSWQHLLRGLWWSGLRLSEAMDLKWSGSGLAQMWIDMEATPPMFHIASELDKTRKDQIFPVAREFAEFLTPAGKSGYVFNPMQWGKSRGRKERPPLDRVVKTIAFIGEVARVKVAEQKVSKPRVVIERTAKDGRLLKSTSKSDVITKYASAHDLRRAFGQRWAARVLAPVLMELMRHQSMATTQQFYLGRNAAAAAQQAWDAAPGDGAKTEVRPKKRANR